MELVKTLCVLALALSALITDIKTKKIKNSINFSFMFLGIAANAADGGLVGVSRSVLGIAAPLVLLVPLYALGMLGAGDVKLFSAVGAIMGAGFTAATTVISFLFGGAIGAALMVIKGHGRYRFRVLGTYLKTCLLTGTISDYREFGSAEKPGWFRFSLAIAPAVAIQLLLRLDHFFLILL